MSTGKDNPFRMVMVLAVICAGAGLALGATYHLTHIRIEDQQRSERMAALRIVLPEADRDGFREVSVPKSATKLAFAVNRKYYEAYDASGELVGYALEADTGRTAYSSTILVTVGVDPKAEVVRGIKITFQQETPGLGARCEEVKAEGTLWDALFGTRKRPRSSAPWFQAQFRGKKYDSFLKVGNKYQNIDGLTGATITTNAVTDAAVAAVKEFRDKVLGAHGKTE